tara:strand:- start:200 stop:424 length:225 start_codon:yes stop_codon:yes gene_type:complete
MDDERQPMNPAPPAKVISTRAVFVLTHSGECECLPLNGDGMVRLVGMAGDENVMMAYIANIEGGYALVKSEGNQ